MEELGVCLPPPPLSQIFDLDFPQTTTEEFKKNVYVLVRGENNQCQR